MTLPNFSEDVDSMLVVGSMRNDAAFGEFYRRNNEPLYRWIYRQTVDADAAADLTSECFAVALATRGRFQPTRGSARAWLWGIASVEVRRWRRKRVVAERAWRRAVIHGVAADDEATAEVDSVIDLRSFALSATVEMNALPWGERHAVALRVLGDRTYEEVGDRLDCSPGAARVRVSRGLAKLRGSLAPYDPKQATPPSTEVERTQAQAASAAPGSLVDPAAR